MKKPQLWMLLGVTLSMGGILLDTFTTIPSFIINLCWFAFIICVLLGVRAQRRLAQTESRPPVPAANKRTKHFLILVAAVTLGVIGGSYLTRREHLGLSFGTEVAISCVTYIAIVAFLYWRVYKRPLAGAAANKRMLIVLAVAFVCFVFAELFAIIDRDSDATQKVQREMNQVVADWQKLPPGIERAEELVRRLRRIDASHAPVDVQRALQEYADALDRGVSVYKAGADIQAADLEIAEKNTALDQALKSHH
jgi:hypothetical protein